MQIKEDYVESFWKYIAAQTPPDPVLPKSKRPRPFLQYGRVTPCGHKYIPDVFPRHCNCRYCWFTWLNQHGELVQTADEVFTNQGQQALEEFQGKKFTKWFKRFMSTLAIAKQSHEGQTATLAKESA